ncbi:hypothetical protein GCM10009863_07890 [Streptomyces axinellae]|uniref:Uncharacterized protein n=1 Tax=Streptomyces axinellae TaxID=552788 RepID=A0ABN3PQH0_9ACTN
MWRRISRAFLQTGGANRLACERRDGRASVIERLPDTLGRVGRVGRMHTEGPQEAIASRGPTPPCAPVRRVVPRAPPPAPVTVGVSAGVPGDGAKTRNAKRETEKREKRDRGRGEP